MKWLSANIILILLAGCYYDSEEYLFPDLSPESCDTSAVTLSGTIMPVLSSSCFACHSNANAAMGGGIRLEEYADIILRANDGSLSGTINHLPGYSPMPKNASKLSDCEIASIEKWIDAGAPDN